MDLKVVKDTFEPSLGPLIVVNTSVATDLLWVRFDPMYRVVWKTFAMDVIMGLAYHVETEVVEWSRSRVHFPLMKLSMLLCWALVFMYCTALHYTFSSLAREPALRR